MYVNVVSLNKTLKETMKNQTSQARHVTHQLSPQKCGSRKRKGSDGNQKTSDRNVRSCVQTSASEPNDGVAVVLQEHPCSVSYHAESLLPPPKKQRIKSRSDRVAWLKEKYSMLASCGFEQKCTEKISQ